LFGDSRTDDGDKRRSGAIRFGESTPSENRVSQHREVFRRDDAKTGKGDPIVIDRITATSNWRGAISPRERKTIGECRALDSGQVPELIAQLLDPANGLAARRDCCGDNAVRRDAG